MNVELNSCNINHYRKAHKANALFLFLSSLVLQEQLQWSIDITIEQSQRYIEADAKI